LSVVNPYRDLAYKTRFGIWARIPSLGDCLPLSFVQTKDGLCFVCLSFVKKDGLCFVCLSLVKKDGSHFIGLSFVQRKDDL
jgi:hypothetical protein